MRTLTALLLVLIAAPAWADTGLYLNTDNKGWKLTRLFAFPEDCDSAARSAVRSGQAIGAGCRDEGALVDTRPARPAPTQQATPQWNPPTAQQPESQPSTLSPYEAAKKRQADHDQKMADQFKEIQRRNAEEHAFDDAVAGANARNRQRGVR